MTIFKYKTERRMQPRPGTNYATVYKQPDLAEQKRLQTWVEDACKQAEFLAKELGQWESFRSTPLPNKKHKHLDGSRYTQWEAMTDLRDQLRKGNDIPDAMTNRWNAAFDENPDMQIEWQQDRPETKPTSADSFERLFSQ